MSQPIDEVRIGSCHGAITKVESHHMEFTIYIDPQGDSSEPDITGSMKWDGCVNWQTNPDCMAHFCTRHYPEDLAAIFKWLYNQGGVHMQTFNEG